MLGSILVGAVLITIVALAVRSIIKDKKSGKSSCGGNCGACGGSCGGCNGSCH